MRTWSTVVAVGVLAVSGCGGGDPSAAGPATATAPAGPFADIRQTDWANYTLAEPSQDRLFHNGTTIELGPGYPACTMFPGGTRPVYADFLPEEQGDPATEDALVLIACGAGDQSLILVRLDYDLVTRKLEGRITGEAGLAFMSYAIKGGRTVETLVRRADGATETREYGPTGGYDWERVK